MNQTISPEKFLQILSHFLIDTNEGFVIIDAQLENRLIVYANTGFTRLTGYALNEVIGKSVNILQGPESSLHEMEEIYQGIELYKNITVSVLNYRKDGSKFWNLFSISPIYESSGKVTHILGTLRDVTAEREHTTRKAEYNSMRSTLETANDIMFNYMSYLQEFSLILQEIFLEDKNDEKNNLLKEFNTEYANTFKKLSILGNIKNYKEKYLGNGIAVLDTES